MGYINKNTKGITIIALAITIVVLLILASISIVILIGDKSIIGQAEGAKDAAEIERENEIVRISTVQAQVKSKHGIFTKTKLEETLEENAGTGETEVIGDEEDKEFLVKFVKTERYYSVTTEGDIEYIGGDEDLINAATLWASPSESAGVRIPVTLTLKTYDEVEDDKVSLKYAILLEGEEISDEKYVDASLQKNTENTKERTTEVIVEPNSEGSYYIYAKATIREGMVEKKFGPYQLKFMAEVSVTNGIATYSGRATNGGAKVEVISPTSGATIKYRDETSGLYKLSSIPKYTNVGVYTVYYQVTAKNYTSNTGLLTITIEKADGSVTAPTAKKLTYTGSEQELVNAGTSTTGTIQYKVGAGEYSTKIPTATNAGTYTVYYKVVGDSNHNDVAEKSINVTIEKATPKINLSAKDVASIDYNSTGTFTATPSVAGTLSVSSSDESYVTASLSTTTGTAGTAVTVTYKGEKATITARTITVTLKPTDSTNYNNATAIFTVTKVAQIPGIIDFETISVIKTYGDAAFTNPLTKTGDGTVTYESSDTSVATVDSTGKVTIVKAGSTTITATVANGNYAYEPKTASYTLTVKKATPKIDLSATDVASIDYNTTGTFTATPSVAGTLSVSSSDESYVTANLSTTTGTAGTAVTVTYKGVKATMTAKTITVTLKPTDSTNYNNATATFTVTKVAQIPGVITAPSNQAMVAKNTLAVSYGYNGDGTVTASSSNTSKATVTVDTSSKTITITGVAAGSCTITIAAAAGTNYTAATSKTFTVTLTAANWQNTNKTTNPYYSDLATAISGATSGNTIKLLNSYTDATTANINKNLTINTNGKTITKTSSEITITADVTINGSGTITTSSDINTLKITNGNVSISNVNLSNTSTSTTANVIVLAASTMTTGTLITNNNINITRSNSVAPAILVTGGTLTCGEGVIENNYSAAESRVIVGSGGMININGATIKSSSTSAGYSAVVTTGTSAFIEMNSGAITSTGATLGASHGDITVSGGTITGARGIVIKNDSKFEMLGGSITSNYAENITEPGVGIEIHGSADRTFNISGGSVYGEYVGISMKTGGTFNISGGSVYGGDVAIWIKAGGTFNISGSTVIASTRYAINSGESTNSVLINVGSSSNGPCIVSSGSWAMYLSDTTTVNLGSANSTTASEYPKILGNQYGISIKSDETTVNYYNGWLGCEKTNGLSPIGYFNSTSNYGKDRLDNVSSSLTSGYSSGYTYTVEGVTTTYRYWLYK